MMKTMQTLVIIEHNPAEMTLLLQMLEEVDHGFHQVDCVGTIHEAYELISNHPPACCLINVHSPDGTAWCLLEQLKECHNAVTCPIVVITNQNNTEEAVRLLHYGVQDYQLKSNLDGARLLKVLQKAMKSWQVQQQLNHLALFDALTGLVNRALFIDRLTQLFEEGKRHRSSFALLYIDLDRFKRTNDHYGHEAGDYLLTSVADKLRENLRAADTAARLGGDEFAVLLPNTDEAKAHHVSFKLVRQLTFELPWQNSLLSVSPSIGLATYPSRAQDYQELMREADFALYRAKNNGRSQYSAYNKKMENETRKLHLLTSAMPRALLNHELGIAYQPIIDIKKRRVKAVEALVRWQYKGEWVPPGLVIELMIERRLSEMFHAWLFEQSIHKLIEWKHSQRDLGLTLNIPASLCHDGKIFDQLHSTVCRLGVKSSDITIEISQAQLIRDQVDIKNQLNTVVEKGFHVAIDDLGSGNCSLQYLASLPCTMVKVDQHFFLTMEKQQRNFQLVEAMTAMSHHLGMKVVAEGVENSWLLSTAETVGCDFAQGYWLGAPVMSESPFSSFYEKSKYDGCRLIAQN